MIIRTLYAEGGITAILFNNSFGVITNSKSRDGTPVIIVNENGVYVNSDYIVGIGKYHNSIKLITFEIFSTIERNATKYTPRKPKTNPLHTCTAQELHDMYNRLIVDIVADEAIAGINSLSD